MFRKTYSCHKSLGLGGPQVIGAYVPSFDRFPYMARDTLHLYRDFWRLIYRYPPQERPDLMFRLRNEFRSKRHLAGSKIIRSAVRRGQAILEVQKSLLDTRAVKESTHAQRGGVRPKRLSLTSSGASQSHVDRVFDQVQDIAGHMLPGLKGYKASLNVPAHRYAANGSLDVMSASRPVKIR
ncbi:Hypothetical protein, putative [Bodo saltans]|uniref:Complex 1 LYR protein domain-containing protein n=1 Tax=Bodo saltans TaxID=75058 RepID=A0A0S4JQG9_BODSA|nr:Hypothetical protein, putative [Bodo saltans]|eukprot:CUG92589.1 Hypothetical protein, putative [Bodo saltans]